MDANLIVNGKIGRSLVVCLRNDKAKFYEFTTTNTNISEPLVSWWKLRWFQSLCAKAQQFQDFGVFCNQTNYLALKRKTFKITKTPMKPHALSPLKSFHMLLCPSQLAKDVEGPHCILGFCPCGTFLSAI